MEPTINSVEEVWEELMSKDIMILRIQDGSGETADIGTIVTCNITGYFSSNSISSDEPFEVLTRQSFKIGEGDAIPAIELPLRHSRAGA